jgi:L-lactate dehydrogenase (cytochrome)
MTQKINRCFNIADLHKKAKSTLPAPVYGYLECGSDDQYSYKNNTTAFDQYQLQPQQLNDVSTIDTHTEVLGCKIDWPVILSPTGLTRMFHPQGELAVARAAKSCGTAYSTSTFSTTGLETIASETDGPKIFQVYVLSDPTLNDELIDRAKAANYNALCLTVDTIVGGNRENVLRSGMTTPPQLTLKSALQFALRPSWVWNYVTNPKWDLANLSNSPSMGGGSDESMADYLEGLLEKKLTWKHAERMIDRWNGPFAIKGILSVEDAKRAVDIGASTLMISNHGGRQLDATPAPIELVSDIRNAVGDKIEIIVDGGIRRGTHILKAIAMGANCCSIGRPYLYGLAAGGQTGVEKALNLLREELERNMKLAGCSNLPAINDSLIRKL